jgi:hypothetical protein
LDSKDYTTGTRTSIRLRIGKTSTYFWRRRQVEFSEDKKLFYQAVSRNRNTKPYTITWTMGFKLPAGSTHTYATTGNGKKCWYSKKQRILYCKHTNAGKSIVRSTKPFTGEGHFWWKYST